MPVAPPQRRGYWTQTSFVVYRTAKLAPMIDDATFGDADDMFKIELLHSATTVMVTSLSRSFGGFQERHH